MPTLYDASKKLRQLPDSAYGTSRKLASISLSKMATSDNVTDQNMNTPEGIVITAEDLERKVKIFRIKIKNIGNYLLQIPNAKLKIPNAKLQIPNAKEKEGVARNLEEEFAGAGRMTPEQYNGIINKIRDSRKPQREPAVMKLLKQRKIGKGCRRLRGGADDESSFDINDNSYETVVSDDDSIIRGFDDVIRDLEDYARELQNDFDEISSISSPEEEERVLERVERSLEQTAKKAKKKGIDINHLENVRDMIHDYRVNEEGSIQDILDAFEEVIEEVEREDEYGLNEIQQKKLGVSSKLINFNSLFGKATQAVDDAQIFFNENIAPYKKSLTAVQIENIDEDLDDINELFKKVTVSPALLALTSRGQTHEPYDQLQDAFKVFRVSVRGVINSSVSHPPRHDEVEIGASTLSGGGLVHRHSHHKHYRQETPSLSNLGKYKNCPQKFLL